MLSDIIVDIFKGQSAQRVINKCLVFARYSCGNHGNIPSIPEFNAASELRSAIDLAELIFLFTSKSGSLHNCS